MNFKHHHCIFCCCSCLQPQRVSILKNKQKAGPNVGKLIGGEKLDMKNLVATQWNRCHKLTHNIDIISGFYSNSSIGLPLNACFCVLFPGCMKSEPFSPDPAALKSILQNEGVKAGGCLGATPKNAIRPSGRGTSVYTVCTN